MCLRLSPFSQFDGILPKGPYLPCVSMAGRALLAGYHRIIFCAIYRAVCFQLIDFSFQDCENVITPYFLLNQIGSTNLIITHCLGSGHEAIVEISVYAYHATYKVLLAIRI